MNTPVAKKKIQIKDVPNLDEIKHALSHTWNAIGGDILQCVANGEEEYGEMKRSEVIEIVLDASYLEINNHGLDTKAFRSLSYDQQKKVAREVFTFSLYGM
jgi:hypothetical protein